MNVQATISFIAGLAGLSINAQKTLQGTSHEGGHYSGHTPVAGQYGGEDEGTYSFDLGSEPPVEATEHFAVFWDGGRRYDLVCSAIDDNTVEATDIGEGDALPAEETPITLVKRKRYDLQFNESQVVAIAAGNNNADVLAVFRDDLAAAVIDVEANGYLAWDHTQGTDSPLNALGDCETLDIYVRNPATLTLGIVQNSYVPPAE